MLLMAAAGLAQAQGQLHKWIGPDGRVHYTDSLPPAGARTQPVQIRRDSPPPAPAPAASAATAATPTPANPTADPAAAAAADAAAQASAAAAAEKAARRDTQDKADQQKQEQADLAKRRCDQALEHVKRTLDMPAVVTDGPNGRENNFADRNARINRAKATARQICGDKYREM